MTILMVLTSRDTLGDTGGRTGFPLDEFPAPYYTFREAGVGLTLASPKGGRPPIDSKSDLPENQTPGHDAVQTRPGHTKGPRNYCEAC